MAQLWMGDLDPTWDEAFVTEAFRLCGVTVYGVKFIVNRVTNVPAGYCFVEVADQEQALLILQNLNERPIPNSVPQKLFKLNWASGAMPVVKVEPEYSLFVGDLSPEVTDATLTAFFKQFYPTCKTAKVVLDVMNNSKGFGFVRFSDSTECQRALTEMNGVVGIGQRPLRVSVATPRRNQMAQQQQQQQQQQQTYAQSFYGQPTTPTQSQPAWGGYGTSYGAGAAAQPAPRPARGLPPTPSLGFGGSAAGGQQGAVGTAVGVSNGAGESHTVFVGNLAAHVSPEELRMHFQPYGELVGVRIPPGRGCGFVEFVHRANAESAILGLAGSYVGGQPVRLSWGHHRSSLTNGHAVPPIAAPPTPVSVIGQPASTGLHAQQPADLSKGWSTAETNNHYVSYLDAIFSESESNRWRFESSLSDSGMSSQTTWALS